MQKNEKIKNKKNKNKEKNKHSILTNINFTIIAIILLIIFCICLTPITFQNDTYYTIKIGELINNSGIDMMDHFSWHEDLSYTYPHWLYDFLTYLVYNIFNMQGIYILTCILSCVLGISIFIINSKLTKCKSISFIITIGALYLLEPYIAARAQLVTFILFIWTIYFIEKFLEKKKIIYGIILVIISILIANLHVAVWPFYFVLYLPYIAEYIIAVISDYVLYKKSLIRMIKIKIKRLSKKQGNEEKLKELDEKLKDLESKISKIKIKREKDKGNPYKLKILRNDNIKWIILIMIICLFTGLLTPIGDTPYTYLYKTMQGNTTQNISEHLPMTLANNTDVICTIIIFLAILIFTKTKIRISDLFMISGLAYLMIITRRQLSMFALIGSIVLTRMIVDMIKIYADDKLEQFENTFKNIFVIIPLTILIVILSYYYMKPKLDDDYVSTSSYPVDACDYILENIDLQNAKFYNEYNYGSYMLFRGIPVFIDSRADLYSPEFSGKEEDIFSDFLKVSGVSTFYENIFEKYKMTHVICYKNSKLNMIITETQDKNYEQLYSDDNFVIYERLNVNE